MLTEHASTFGILSSAPPTPCGLATFSTALGRSLERQGVGVGIARVVDAPEGPPTPVLAHLGDLVASDPTSTSRVVDALNGCDAVFIQHEYGLYGGLDGSDVLRVLGGLEVPVVATLHTVLSRPTAHQRRVLNRVLRRADAVVVMTDKAETILRATNDVGGTPVWVIPHGAALGPAAPRAPHERPVLLTWGLIGPGKGIQWVIDALVDLGDLDPAPLYVIAGRTHPKVLAHEGDVYRDSLIRRVDERGVGHMVHFDNSYRTLESLSELISDSDVVVLPYDSRDQATSGVLVDAVAAGRPVVATAFPHAIELLSSGAGIVVDQGDVGALSAAIRRIVTDDRLAAAMGAEAHKIAPGLSWDAVGSQYLALANQLLRSARVAV
jgi:polysaccharide biosynthesis protein PslF